MHPSPNPAPTLAVRRFQAGVIGIAVEHSAIVRVVLLAESVADAMEALPPGELVMTPLSERFFAACERYFATGHDSFAPLPVVLAPEESFSGKVYRALRAVTAGATVTYGELARRIGRPTAARAVAGALGRNPTPLLVPCHRVVAADGLGGFTAPGGITRKRWLLELEAKGK